MPQGFFPPARRARAAEGSKNEKNRPAATRIGGSYGESRLRSRRGLHRWVYRLLTYVAFMHDAYPPFRLDLGAPDPAG
jgi:hypothetical protein